MKRPSSHEIDEKGFHEKLCASDRSGQLEITLRVIEARNLSENIRVEQTHDGSGQPSAHTVKEQHAPEEHRELRHSTRTTSSIVQSTRRTLTSTF